MKRIGKPAGIRVGQVVRIITPEFFVRCGYPMTFAAEAERIRNEHGEAIRRFFQSQGIELRGSPHVTHAAVHKVAKVMAYESCKANGWGGRDRRIHTHRFEEYAGANFTVQGVRFVKTGEYMPGRFYGTYDGYEEDPPYLGNEKTHRILTTTFREVLPGGQWPDLLEIEAAHVEALATAEDGRE